MKPFLFANGKERLCLFGLTFLLFSFLSLLHTSASAQQLTGKELSLAKGKTSGQKIISAIKAAVPEARFTYDEVLNNKLAGDVEITTSPLSVGQVLELLKKTFGINYRVDGNRIVLSFPNSGAGQGTGSLKGRVVEFETSEPLPGATVRVVEKNDGVTTDPDGYYKIPVLPAGKYTLEISFIGYTVEKVSVEVKAGREATHDVKLQGDNNILGEVVITEVAESRAPVAHATERDLVNQIQNAPVVISGISSEQIGKSADRNAAEAVRRVSGVTVKDERFVVIRGMNERYNLTYLNNNIAPSTEVYSRAFTMDLIPSRIIDRIIVYKSPSPDLLADMTGGAVKIFTKDARTVKHLDVELQLGYREGTTFNNHFLTYEGGKYDFLGFDDGTRKLPSSVPQYGSLKQASISQKEYVRSFSPILTHGEKTAIPNMQGTLNYYNSFKIAHRYLSTLTSLSYKHEQLHGNASRQEGPPGGGVQGDMVYQEDRNTETGQLNLLQNFTYHLNDSNTFEFKNFVLVQGQKNTIVRTGHLNMVPILPGGFEGYYDPTFLGTLNKINLLSWNQRFLYGGNLGGNHAQGRHKLQWNLGYTYSRYESPDERVIRLSYRDWGEATGEPALQWTGVPRGDGLSEGSFNLSMIRGMMSRTWTRNTEGVYNGSVDYTYRLAPWVSIKAGIYQQFKERRLYRRAYLVNEGDLRGGYQDLVTVIGAYGDYIDTKAVYFREQDLGRVWSDDYLRDNTSGLKVYDRTLGSDAYVATEQNNSGYVAFNLTPGWQNITAYGGLRVEHDHTQIGGAYPRTGDLGATGINLPVLVDYAKLDWLPSLNVSYRPTQSVVFRVSYGRTVNRPEIREASPYSDYDYVNGMFISGNPRLRAAVVDNFDARFEFYPQQGRSGESVSLGVFYKDLQNPIERINTTIRLPSAYPIITFQNATGATIQGIEFDLRKSLGFIPFGAFRDLSVISNVTIIRSQVENHASSTATVDIDRALQGQAPYIINAGLYYDNAGSGTKISLIYNVAGSSIYAAGRPYQYSSGTDGPVYRGGIFELSRNLLDLAISQRLVKSLQCKLSIQNLLDAPIRMAEDYNYTNKYETESFVTENDATRYSAGDPISYRFNPGLHCVLNLTYSF